MKLIKKKKFDINNLSISNVEGAIKNEKYKERYFFLLKNTIYTIIIIFAIGVLLATLVMPVFEINGDSMTPTYSQGDVVVALNIKKFEHDDVIAFYYENKILVRRVIATEGEWVNIKDGVIYVDGQEITSYSDNNGEFEFGDIEYPYQVPSNQLFVLSDNLNDLQDSRSSYIGCIKKEDIIGKVLFKLWG